MSRKKLVDSLSKLGNRVFYFLARCEDKGVFSRSFRFLRFSLTGVLVVFIGYLTAQTSQARRINCYVPVYDDFDCDELLERVRIPEITVTPNPTQGADSVTVKAHVELLNSNEFDPFVNARLWLEADTVEMRAVDSIFDEQEEDIVGEISVEGLEPGEYWIYASATTSLGYTGTHGIPLIVSSDSINENISDSNDSTTED